MEDMNKIEMACFEIIANVGSARSCFIEAIDLAGEGKIDEAEARVAEGEQFFLVGHAKHGEMIAQEPAATTSTRASSSFTPRTSS